MANVPLPTDVSLPLNPKRGAALPRPRMKILGILGLLLFICIVTGTLEPESFLKVDNIQQLIHRTALFAILGIGVAFVIVTGGIDLSIGSVIALIGLLLPYLIHVDYSTRDRAPLLELNAGTTNAIVEGNLSDLKAGDFAYAAGDGGAESAGQAVRALLRVKSAAFNPAFDFYGRKRQATSIEYETAAAGTIGAGAVTKAHAISHVDPAAKAVVLRTGDSIPSAGDRVTLMNAAAGAIYEYDVVSATGAGSGEARLTLNDPGGTLTSEHAFALIHAHHQIMGVAPAIILLLLLSAAIGLTHGLLITKLRLQPFVVTLCGLLIYRSLARWITVDQTQGFGIGFPGLKYLAVGYPFSVPLPFINWLQNRSTSGPLFTWIAVPMSFLIMAAIGVIASIFLNRTIWGRYLLALGRNEQAARYSGINTDRMIILPYVICSLLAGFGGMLFVLETNMGQPADFGNFYELYAIAAAVLGGCSLRGGEGSILGVVIGAAVMRVLYNATILLHIKPQLELAIIGVVILGGVITDELVKRYAARRRAMRLAA